MAWFRSRDGAILLSAVAFLAFIERAFLDWRFVFAEFVPDTDIATTALAMGFYVAGSGEGRPSPPRPGPPGIGSVAPPVAAAAASPREEAAEVRPGPAVHVR